MIAGYIYYGMYYARTLAPVTTPESEATTTTPGMDDDKRQEIINALQQEAAPLNEAKQAEIIDSLGKQSSQQTSQETEARRQEIIKSLQQN